MRWPPPCSATPGTLRPWSRFVLRVLTFPLTLLVWAFLWFAYWVDCSVFQPDSEKQKPEIEREVFRMLP